MGSLKHLFQKNGRTAYFQLSSYVSFAKESPNAQRGFSYASVSGALRVSQSQPLHSRPGLALPVLRQLSNTSGPVTQDVVQLAEVADVAVSKTSIGVHGIVVNRTLHPNSLPPLSSLTFGAVYSDHMLTLSWSVKGGWARPSIDPLKPIPLHPCAQVLHYGLECFEGMKAYYGKDGRIRLFRPDKNMARLASSCERLQLPQFDKEELLECIKALVREDREWVPRPEGYSIYLRPTCIATTPYLGVGPAKDALLFVVMSPVGPYFPEGLKPISLLIDTENVRAFPGGVGDKKLGGNYGPTIRPQVAAAQKGCSQVLYVLQDGKGGGGLIGESGAMNVFFVIKKEGVKGGRELVTPNLDGLILPGVTRDSVLEIAKQWGEFEVSERPIRLDEVKEAHASGRLEEIFGTGTAVIIQPISRLQLPDGENLQLPYNEDATLYWSTKPQGSSINPRTPDEPFNVSGRVYRSLLDIQYGHVPSSWSVPIDSV